MIFFPPFFRIIIRDCKSVVATRYEGEGEREARRKTGREDLKISERK